MAFGAHVFGLLVAFGLGIFLFSQGFLLNRKELANVNFEQNHKRIYNGAVIILVDALKFDFIDPNLNGGEGHWAGNFKSIRDVLLKYPHRARLFHFEADPPTTTLQRLKGLTTGGFPTFIDVSANFGGDAIKEDNLISQLASAKMSMSFYGDDTWLSLFPDQFTKAFPFSSFDVMDLDTVDTGIQKHLNKQLHGNDPWPQVTIAHFLGVDHCGHRYGQNNPEMRRKLSEMNAVVTDVMERLPDDMLLVVMGDHGMTMTGDHGGDSASEVDAGLFLYSKVGFSGPVVDNGPAPRVHQIDLVPTLAVLLGIPIPFSNVGRTSLSFFPNQSMAEIGYRANLKQICNYVNAYQSSFNDLPRKDMDHFVKTCQTLLSRKVDKFEEFVKETNDLLDAIKETCKRKWTTFRIPFILAGLVIMACVLLHLCSFDALPSKRSIGLLIASSLPGSIDLDPIIASSFPLLYATWLVIRKIRDFRVRNIHFPSYITTATIILFISTCAMVFSNSYIVNEAKSLNMVLQTILSLLVVASMLRSQPKIEKQQRTGTTIFSLMNNYSVILPYLISVMTLRCAHFFAICREEQLPHCEANNITRPLSSFGDASHSYRSWRFSISTLLLIAVVWLSRYWLKREGNLNGYRLAVVCIKYCLPLLTLLYVVNIYIHCLPSEKLKRLDSFFRVIPVRVCLIGSVFCLIVMYLKPLMIFVIKEEQKLSIDDHNLNSKTIVPLLWNHLKQTYNASRERTQKISGLATVFTATFSSAYLFFLIFFSVLIGDGYICPLILQFLAQISVSVLIHKSLERNQNLIFSIIFAQMSCYFFYCLGHQPTLSNIPWHSAFIGFRGDPSQSHLPSIYILLNTFSSYFLISFLMPMTVISYYTPEWLPKFWNTSIYAERGEYTIFETADNSQNGVDDFLQRLRQRYRAYIICAALMTMASMIAATYHRRHLMVWKIFCPKMMFSTVSLAGTLVGCVLGYSLACRIFRSVRNLEKSLSSSNYL